MVEVLELQDEDAKAKPKQLSAKQRLKLQQAEKAKAAATKSDAAEADSTKKEPAPNAAAADQPKPEPAKAPVKATDEKKTCESKATEDVKKPAETPSPKPQPSDAAKQKPKQEAQQSTTANQPKPPPAKSSEPSAEPKPSPNKEAPASQKKSGRKKKKSESKDATDKKRDDTAKPTTNGSDVAAKVSKTQEKQQPPPAVQKQSSNDRDAKTSLPVVEDTSQAASTTTTSSNSNGEAQPRALTFYPFAYVLLDDELNHHCWHCLKSGDNAKLHRCSACKIAWFCSKRCQQMGWMDHRPECHGLDYRVNLLQMAKDQVVPDVEVRLLGRIALRYRQIQEGKDSKYENFYENRTSERSIMEIWSHDKDIRGDKDAYKKYEEIRDKLLAFYPNKALPDEPTIFQLHCRNYINRHAISDKDYMREIGKGLYLDLCAYDHSCRPNTIYTCNGVVATLRPLGPNVRLLDRQSTFYSYIDLLNSKQERQKMLLDTWYFECHCARCEDDDEHILSSIKCEHCQQPVYLFGGHAKRDVKNNVFMCGRCSQPLDAARVQLAIAEMRYIDILVSNDQIDKHDKPLQFAKELLDRYRPLLSEVNVYFARVLQAAIRNAEPSHINDMLQWHLDATACLRVCYPHRHPALAYHLMNIGVLANKAGQLMLAQRHFEEALEMTRFSLGENAHITNVISSNLQLVVKAQEEQEPVMD